MESNGLADSNSAVEGPHWAPTTCVGGQNGLRLRRDGDTRGAGQHEVRLLLKNGRRLFAYPGLDDFLGLG